MDFGLGLVLSFTDNATAGINNAVNSLNQLTTVAGNASTSLNQMASLSALSVVSNQLGDSFMKAGKGLLGTLQNVLTETQRIGSEFEGFDITLSSLFGGGAKGAKESEKALGKLFDFAKKSPLEIGEVKDMIVTLQSQGVNAFEKTKGAVSGTRQEFLAFLTDLKSFKPEVPVERFKLAIQNYIGSGEKKMMRTVFDMGDIEDIIGHGVSSTVEGRMNDIVEMVENKGLTNLSNKMSKTWQGVASNISDAFTQIYYAVADNGVFKQLKKSFMEVANSIIYIDNDRLQNLGKTLAEGLNIVVKPLEKVAKFTGKLITKLVDLCETHPNLVKLGIVLTAIAGSLLVMTGVVLKVTSALSGLSLMILAFGNSTTTMSGLFSAGIKKILTTLAPLTLAVGLMYLAWKSDFAGVRTITTEFVNTIFRGFNTAREAVNGSVTSMVNKVKELDSSNSFFGNFTISLMKVMVLIKSLSDGWSDFTLSEDNFLKAKELGILPLIESIFDLKYRFDFFKQGFIAGWKKVSNNVKEFLGGITKSVKGTQLEGFFNTLTSLLQKLSNNDPEAWEQFGEFIGSLSAKLLVATVALKLFDSVLGKVLTLTTAFSGIANIAGVIGSLGSAFMSIGGSIIGVLGRMLPSISSVLELGLRKVFSSSVEGLIPNIRIIFAGLQDTIVSALTGIATALGVPVGAVVAVIVALLSTVLIYATTHGEEFKDKMLSMCTTLKDEALAIWTSLKEGFARIWDNLKNAVTPVVDSFNTLKSKFSETCNVLGQNEVIQSLIGYLSSIGETIVGIVVPIFNGLVRIISVAFQSIWNVVVTIFNGIVNLISSSVSMLLDIISGILDIIVGIFTLDLDKIFSGVSTIFGSILKFITTNLTSVWNIIMSILSGIVNIVGSILTTIVNVVVGAVKGLVSIIGSNFNLMLTTIKSVWTTISGVFSNILGKISGGVQNKFDKIRDTITNVMTGAQDIVKSAIDKIKNFFDFDWKLPKLKLPHFNIEGKFSLDPPSVPSFGVDWYAKGGVFNEPSIIGVGEAGKEAVMPLENNTGWIGQLASMLSTHMTASNMTPVSTQQVVNNRTESNSGEYMTSNSTSNDIYEGDTDNSITFKEGSIQVYVQSATEEEARKLARKVMEYIKRYRELDRMAKYS